MIASLKIIICKMGQSDALMETEKKIGTFFCIFSSLSMTWNDYFIKFINYIYNYNSCSWK
jgi:hypothetical protein